MKKKVLSMLMVTAMTAALLAGCGGSKDDAADSGDAAAAETTEAPAEDDAAASEEDADADAEADSSEESDLAYVQEKGTLVVGITDFEPMDYRGEGEEWIGFDADMAKAFGEKLGVDVEFVEINWDNKIMELEGKTIDCVWNGMTLTDEVTSAMACSEAYCNNAQVVVLPADKADQYQDVESLADLSFAVEAGSAGKEQAEANGLEFTEVESQAAALMEVDSGTSDAAIIDSLMAGAMVGEGTSYEDMTYTVGLNSEEYGVGFRKGSDLVDELNAFFEESKEDGTMEKIAEEYGVQAALINE